MLPLSARLDVISHQTRHHLWRLLLLVVFAWIVPSAAAELPYKPVPLLIELHPPFPGPYFGVAAGPNGSVIVGAIDNVGVFDGLRWRHIRLPNFSAARALLTKGDRIWVGGPRHIGWVDADSVDNRFHSVFSDIGGDVYHLLDAGENSIAVMATGLVLISSAGRVLDRVQFPRAGHYHWFRWANGWMIRSLEDSFFVTVTDRLNVSEQTPLPSDIMRRDRIMGAVPLGDSIFLSGVLASYDWKDGILSRVTSPDWGDLQAEHLMNVFSWGEPPALLRLGVDGGAEAFDPKTKRLLWHARVGEEISGNPLTYPMISTLGLFFASRSSVSWMPSASDTRRLSGARQDGYGVDASATGFWISTSDGSWHVDATSWEVSSPMPDATWTVRTTGVGLVRGQMNAMYVGDRRIWLGAGSEVRSVVDMDGGFVTAQGTRYRRWNAELNTVNSVETSTITTSLARSPSGDILIGTDNRGIHKWNGVGAIELVRKRGDLLSVVAAFQDEMIVLWSDGLLEIGRERVQLPVAEDTTWKSITVSGSRIIAGARLKDRAALALVQKDSHGHWSVRSLDHRILDTLSQISRVAICGDRIAIAGAGGCIDIALSFFDTVPVLSAPRISHPRAAVSGLGSSSLRTVDMESARLAFQPDEDELRFVMTGGLAYWGHRVRFYYRILPDSVDWSELDAAKEVILQRIGTGSHTLEIESRTLTDKQTSRFKIIRPPYWYATRWAYGTYFFGLIGIAFGAVSWRTRRLARHARVLEERVAQRTAELQKANESKDEFLASMSHEIRNPLNGVIGLSGMLHASAPTERDRRLVESLRACADQLRFVLDDILDFAVIGRGDVLLQVAPFDPAAAVRAAALAVDPKMERTRVTIAPELAGVRLSGDEGKVRQIITNLVSNAHKYGVPPAAEVSASFTEDRFAVSVSNTGPDIPPEDQSRIFGSFERGRSQAHKYTRGAGLGLTICARFARAMGGDVTVKSESGLTCFTFTVSLPLATAATVEAAAPRPSARDRRRSLQPTGSGPRAHRPRIRCRLGATRERSA